MAKKTYQLSLCRAYIRVYKKNHLKNIKIHQLIK